ncbi:MAG: porin [Zoogloea sp.]|nr:porin [Zoogloea sp.]
MQKKLIALAVAGLASTGAFAQSSVTVYGVADAYVAKVSANDRQSSPVVNSGGLASSRLGFKGVEDLGNGLKALFVLEYGLTIDQNSGVGAGGNMARQQMVGLTGGFGTAVAGRLQTTAYDWAVKYDLLAGTAISPLQNVVTQAAIGGSGGTLGMGNSNVIIGATSVGARANNAVAYIAPAFGGVTLAVNYARDLTADDGTTLNSGSNNRSTLASATWTGGPASVGLVVAQTSLDTGAASNVKDWALGGSYDLGVAKLTATYQSSKTSLVAGTSPDANKAFSIGAAVPVTAAGTVVASFAKFQNKNAVDADPKSFTVAYLQGLSKRTTAYAGYTRTSNGDGSSDYGVAGLAPNGLGNSANALVAGLNHKF